MSISIGHIAVNRIEAERPSDVARPSGLGTLLVICALPWVAMGIAVSLIF